MLNFTIKIIIFKSLDNIVIFKFNNKSIHSIIKAKYSKLFLINANLLPM